MLAESKELTRVLREGRTIAEQFDGPMTSAHVLLCLFIIDNQAKKFLTVAGLDFETLLGSIEAIPHEPPHIWEEIRRRAHDIARTQNALNVDTLHMLISLCSFVDSAAYQLIRAQHLVPADIRSNLMSQMHAEPVEIVEASTPTSPVPGFGGDRDPTSPGAAAHRPAPKPRAVGLTSSATQDLARRIRSRSADDADIQTQEVADEKPTLRPLHKSLSNIPLPSRQRLSERRSQQRTPSNSAQVAVSKRASNNATGAEPRRASRSSFRPEAYRLIPREFPILARLGRNLSEAAIEGKIDEVIGRDDIIVRLVDTLNKRRSNNPLLIGEPGVGKTAIVEGFARYLIEQARADIPTGLEQRIIVSIEASSMVAGTSVRGAFSERMTQLKREVQRAHGRVIVFFDELHHWIGAGGSNDTGSDASGELKTALARGEFPCIGATTWNEFTRHIEPDSAFTRRFEILRVTEPDLPSTLRIVTGMRPTYEAHHGIKIPNDVIDFAVKLAHRYLPNRRNPDKSFGVIDFAGALARRAQESPLTEQTVARAVADQAGIAPERLMMADRERYAQLDSLLGKEIIGQRDAVTRVTALLQRNYAGFAAGRPIGSFLFLGPTGVGKTAFARAIARVLFGEDDAIVRIDMSEYMESHTVSRLIGAPPGYVGHDAAGLLTEPVRRSPYQLILLDEIEKAHPDVLNLLIQVLDEGRLTDSRGHTVDFTSTIVVMTTNLGAEALTQSSTRRTVGFAQQTNNERDEARAKKVAQGYFRPEIWNRIDEAIVFPALTEAQVAQIAERLLQQSSDCLEHQRGISFTCSADVVPLLIRAGGYDAEHGARPMRRTIERVVEQFVARMILEGRATAGDALHIGVCDNELIVEAAAETTDDSEAPTVEPISPSQQNTAPDSSENTDKTTTDSAVTSPAAHDNPAHVASDG